MTPWDLIGSASGAEALVLRWTRRKFDIEDDDANDEVPTISPEANHMIGVLLWAFLAGCNMARLTRIASGRGA